MGHRNRAITQHSSRVERGEEQSILASNNFTIKEVDQDIVKLVPILSVKIAAHRLAEPRGCHKTVKEGRFACGTSHHERVHDYLLEKIVSDAFTVGRETLESFP